MTLFSQYLTEKFGLPARKAAATDRSVHRIRCRRGEILLAPGTVPHNAWFIEKGCLRSYVTDRKGKEHILQFAPEQWLISDLYAVYHRQPATVCIDAVEDTEAVAISPELMNELMQNDKGSNLLLFVNSLHTLQRRLTGVFSATAEERYTDFVRSYPSLHQRLPLGMIASYIGVTPQSLSRIRKRMVRR